MNSPFKDSQVTRSAVKSLFLGALVLTVVASSARSSSAQCCGWGWSWPYPCCYRPSGCYQPVCPCQPVCGCQPTCCPGSCGSCCSSSCCSSCAAPSCGTCPCGPGGCGVSYRVGPGTGIAWTAPTTQAFARADRRSLPSTTNFVASPTHHRTTNQTAGMFHTPTRSSVDFVARRDYGPAEQPSASPEPEAVPISMSEVSGRY
jgi:hypothetical protein